MQVGSLSPQIKIQFIFVWAGLLSSHMNLYTDRFVCTFHNFCGTIVMIYKGVGIKLLKY